MNHLCVFLFALFFATCLALNISQACLCRKSVPLCLVYLLLSYVTVTSMTAHLQLRARLIAKWSVFTRCCKVAECHLINWGTFHRNQYSNDSDCRCEDCRLWFSLRSQKWTLRVPISILPRWLAKWIGKRDEFITRKRGTNQLHWIVELAIC